MPESSGEIAAVSHRSHTATPGTTLSKAPPDLPSKLSSTTGPVKNSTDAKLYLEQRSLIAVDNNFNLNTLAHLLVTTSLDPKIPNHPTNIMRAVALLLVSQCQSTLVKEIAVVISDRLLNPTSQVLNQLECEKEFLNTLCGDQSKHTQKLHETIKAASASTQRLESSLSKLDNLEPPHPQPWQDQDDLHQTSANELVSNLVESSKSITKAVDDLKPLSVTQHSLTAAQCTATMPSYTNITSTHAPHPSSQTFNPNAGRSSPFQYILKLHTRPSAPVA